MLQNDYNNQIYNKNFDILCRNLISRAGSLENNSIVRNAYFKELASVIGEHYNPEIHTIDSLRDEYRNICVALDLFSKTEKHVFCFYLANDKNINKKITLEDFIHDISPKPRRLCYVKNHYSDIAYRIFDTALEGVTSEYADSFDLVAQSVFYENCSGCILPFESEGGGVMPGIKAIAEKYELNKSYVCHVDAGGQMTKFVLFTRGIWVDEKANNLEFTVTTPGVFHCSDIIDAAEHFGFVDGRVSSVSFANEYQRTSSFTFTGGSDHMKTMLLYLSLEYERSNIKGIYNEIGVSGLHRT